MEPIKKYYTSITTLGNIFCEKEKRIAALEDIERQLILEFGGEKLLPKKPETSIFSNPTNIENLFWTLITNLESCSETSDDFLRVLCLACKHLLKKLKVDLHLRICGTCSDLAERAFAENNWSLLEKCFKCFKVFDNREWNNVLHIEQRRNRIVKIIHSGVSIGKEELCNIDKEEFAALQILIVEVFSNVIKTELFKKDDILKPNECFMLLFPLLFNENSELRKVASHTFVYLKNRCPDVSRKLFLNCPSLKEQLKRPFSKSLAQFARTHEPDWVDLWCLMVDLLGQECTARKNTELINNLLEAEEIGFRSPNMNTRYKAFIGWRFLVNKFLDTSLEDSTRRLKLLMQPLVTSNSKTMDITIIKFEIWWQLITGIEPCIQRHATNVLYHFLNFCFGPVSDGSAANNVRGNSDLPAGAMLASRRPATSSSTNYPLVTIRRWRGIEVNRTDALAQILNLNTESKKECKLQNFKSAVISHPQTFLSLSRMLIHSVGECIILSVDCKEMSSQERRFYLREIWRSLLLHVRSVDKTPLSANDGHDTSERHERTEMMKNIFRILLRLNELAINNQQLAYICLYPIIDTILSTEFGLSDEVLTSRNYYVGTDLMMGTPLLILLDILLSPACITVKDPKHDNGVMYILLLQRVWNLGVRSSEITILFTQALLKRIDAALSNTSVEGSRLKSIWIMFSRTLTTYASAGNDINQGTEENADFTCLMSVLMFPIIYSKIILIDQDLIVRIWGQLYQAFQQNVLSNVQSVVGNEICNTLCGKVQQEICRKKSIRSDELLYIMCLVKDAVDQIPFHSVNKFISGNSSDAEKLGHLQQCFQLLQTLSSEIQKLKEQDNMYINVVTQYANCYKVFCDNVKECPVQFLTLFFIEQVQFLLSVKIENNDTSVSRTFFSTCMQTWSSFLNSLLSSCLRTVKQNKQKLVKMIQPALLSSFAHTDHAIHDITINFAVKENIIVQTNHECNKCRIMQEGMSLGRTTSVFPTNTSGESSAEKFKVLLARPLTKHQREVLRHRKDDIPALYQDLTQDSQPSFCGSQDMCLIAVPRHNTEHKQTTSGGVHFTSPSSTGHAGETSSPLSKEEVTSLGVDGSPSFEASLRQLLGDSTESSDKGQNHTKIAKCLKMGDKPKHKDKHLLASESPVVKSSEIHTAQHKNQKNDVDAIPTHKKTILVIKRATNNILNSSTTNAPLTTIVKKSPSVEDKKMNSIPLCILKPSDLKYNKSPKESSHTIKMCISKLKTGNPEVKSIMTNIPSVLSEKSSDRENLQSNLKNSTDLLIMKSHDHVTSSETPNLKENMSASCHIEQSVMQPLENSVEVCINDSSSDRLKSLKNCDESVDQTELTQAKKENSGIIVHNIAENTKESKKSPQIAMEQTIAKQTYGCNEPSSIKEVQNDISVQTSNSNTVVSPARVILKRLEMNEVNNTTCRALQFQDQVPKKSDCMTKQTSVKHKIESDDSDCNSANLEDLHSCASASCTEKELPQKELVSENVEEKYELEKNAKEQLPALQTHLPKEAKPRSSCSRVRDSESELREEYQTRSKTPPTYQTRSKPLTMFHFTRTYEKKKSNPKTDQNQSRKNSPKEKLAEVKDFMKQKDLEIVEVVNQKPSASLKAVQNNSTSLNVSLNLSDLESSTLAVTSAEFGDRDKTKDNVLVGHFIQSTDPREEMFHINSESPNVNHSTQCSEEKLFLKGAVQTCNRDQQKEEVPKCVGESQEKVLESSEGISKSPKTCENETTVTSPTQIQCTGNEVSRLDVQCMAETDKSMEEKLAVTDGALSGDPESTEGKKKITSEKPNSIPHYFPRISIPSVSPSDFEEKESLTIKTNHMSDKDMSSDSKPSSKNCSYSGDSKHEEEVNQINSESSLVISSEPSHSTSTDVSLHKSSVEQRDVKNELNNTTTEVSPTDKEVTSQILCDKGEYVRQLSLMPQSANTTHSPKAHRISTRSDWARRFGAKSEIEMAKNIDDWSEKDCEENIDSSSDITGSVDSLEYQDFIESSQETKEILLKECIIQVVKLCIMPGCVLDSVEGSLLVTDEISSGTFRVVKKTDNKEKGAPNADNSENAESIEKTKVSLCVNSIDTVEDTSKQGFELAQEVSDVNLVALPAEVKLHNLSMDDKNNDIDNKSNESAQILKDNSGKDVTCSSECNEKPVSREVIDLTLDTENENENGVENMDTNSDAMCLDKAVADSGNNCTSVPDELGKGEKKTRKRKSELSKNDSKRRKITKLCSIEKHEHTKEPDICPVTEESLDTGVELPSHEKAVVFSPSEAPNATVTTNDSPVKMKKFKLMVKSEEASPTRKLLSGRAAQLVGLALTKKQVNNGTSTPSTSSEVGTEETNNDIVFTFNAEGQQEKVPWVRHTPQSEASPGRTNLKRRLSDVEDPSDVTPSRKSVRFADPEVTKKLHFQKNEIPEKTTFRIVRTKKGKIYVQSNIPVPRDLHRKGDKSVDAKPVWPSLKDCESSTSDVVEQLAVTPQCLDVLTSALTSRNISTIGELCSLKETDIDELPIKAPKIIVFKLVMQAYEDKMKNAENCNTVRQQHLHPTARTGQDAQSDLKTRLSSMNRDALRDLLKESLSESDFKKLLTDDTKNVQSASKSVGVATEYEMQDKASSTDEDVVQHVGYCLSDALNKQVQQNEMNKLINEVVKILLHYSSVSCKVDSASNIESASESETVHVDVNQCFELLRCFYTKSALSLDSARKWYQDTVKEFGVCTVLSEILKCGETDHEASAFVRDVINCIKTQFCAEQETGAKVFQSMVTDDTGSLAIQHFTAKQLTEVIPHAVSECGDHSVLKTAFSHPSVTLNKVLKTVADHFSSDNVDKKNYMNTVFKLLMLPENCDKLKQLIDMFSAVCELMNCK